MIKIAIFITTFLIMWGGQCVAEDSPAEGFSQRDMNIAIRMQHLSDLVEALDQTRENVREERQAIEQGQPPKGGNDARGLVGLAFYVDALVKELDQLVGKEKLAAQIDNEIERLQNEKPMIDHPFLGPGKKLEADDPRIQRLSRLAAALREFQGGNKPQQDGAGQPATAPESEGEKKPQPDAEGRPR